MNLYDKYPTKHYKHANTHTRRGLNAHYFARAKLNVDLDRIINTFSNGISHMQIGSAIIIINILFVLQYKAKQKSYIINYKLLITN